MVLLVHSLAYVPQDSLNKRAGLVSRTGFWASALQLGVGIG